MTLYHDVLRVLQASGLMLWSMLWALILGFLLSGIVQTFASRKFLAKSLGGNGPLAITRGTALGALSSSCSYAATALAKTLFQGGAGIIPSLAFMLASTNLVIELSVVLGTLMGWKFVVAEFIGGVLMVAIMATIMKLFGPLKGFRALQEELTQADSDTLETASPKTREGWCPAAQAAVREWKMIAKEILIGVLLSGLIMELVPDGFWEKLFLSGSASGVKMVQNALVGPLISVLSFVCSVGNIPLAAALYRSGIGFGGALSFIYADLIVLPILLIYRKYYGTRLALWIFAVFYVSMASASLLVEVLFQKLNWIPAANLNNGMPSAMTEISIPPMNATFWLNIGFSVLALGVWWLSKKALPAEECCH